MYEKCIICDTEAADIMLNDLPMRKCLNCALIWRRNFDIPADYYTGNTVDLSDEKITARRSNAEDRIKIFRKYANLDNLCDIGTGEGIFLQVLKDFGYINIVGVEPNMEYLDFIQSDRLNIIRGSIEDVGGIIKKNNIRTVTMLHLIEHLADPASSLEEIYDYLPAGGFLIIETPDIDAYSFKRTNYRQGLVCREHLFYFNRQNLIKLLKKTGFKIIASGKKDFDQDNMGIKESLFRLGLMNRSSIYAVGKSQSSGDLFQTSSNNQPEIFKKIIRKILNKLVILLGRQDYMWAVAKK